MNLLLRLIERGRRAATMIYHNMTRCKNMCYHHYVARNRPMMYLKFFSNGSPPTALLGGLPLKNLSFKNISFLGPPVKNMKKTILRTLKTHPKTCKRKHERLHFLVKTSKNQSFTLRKSSENIETNMNTFSSGENNLPKNLLKT